MLKTAILIIEARLYKHGPKAGTANSLYEFIIPLHNPANIIKKAIGISVFVS